jgi:cleavage and polyadenylation specificity factor subunit 4
MTNPLVGPSALRDLINPQFHQNNFPEELYIKSELGIRLDKGTVDHSSSLTPLLTLHSHR